MIFQVVKLVTELSIGDTRIAVAASAETEPLGRIVWYSISERPIPFDAFESLLDSAGISEEVRPQRTRPSDAFKAAVRDVENKDYTVEYDTTVDANGAKKTDPKTMLVVNRVHNTAIDALPVLMKVHYDPNVGLWFESSVSCDPGLASLLEREIRERYGVYRNSYKAEDIRTMLADAMKKAYAVMVKRHGGVYFVPRGASDVIDRLAEVVDNLPGCQMVSIPVIDREPERKTLLKRYEQATLERLEALMLQVREMIQKGERIVPSQYARFFEEASYIAGQRGKYESLLKSFMSRVDVEAQALQGYIGQLGALVED